MKRGQSGYSFVVCIDKEAGHSSHAALSGVKHALGESRVGHAGTLDPFATGVLVALVGPAARLNRYIVSDRKSYIADIVFGRSTATDDIDGPTICACPIPTELEDPAFARSILSSFTGSLMQRPPVYSAIKRDGKRAYNQARKGTIIDIEPRPVEVISAELLGIERVDDEGRTVPLWRVSFEVSKGTYIRSLARDIGASAGSCAHLGALCRTRSGKVTLDDCVAEGADAETLVASALDPLRLLGMKAAFLDGAARERVAHGNPISAEDIDVLGYSDAVSNSCDCCSSPFYEIGGTLEDREPVAMIGQCGLKAIYAHDGSTGTLRADCVFQEEVSRGSDIIA